MSCVYEIDIDHNNNRPCANGARSLMILWVRLNCVVVECGDHKGESQRDTYVVFFLATETHLLILF